jgi:hypothetical protein
MGEGACAVIEEALRTLKIEMRPGVAVASVDERGVRLSSGEAIDAATVVWCAGMRAHPLAAAFDETHGLRIKRLPLHFPKWGILESQALHQYWQVHRQILRLVRDVGISAIHCGRVLPEGW